jgi:hypothetical protein
MQPARRKLPDKWDVLDALLQADPRHAWHLFREIRHRNSQKKQEDNS